MLVLLTAAVGVVGVIGSLIFSGWQARQLVKQIKLQTSLAGSTGVYQPLRMLHGVLRMVFEEPDLRPYLYEGKTCSGSDHLRWRVVTVAEMLGDALEMGLFSTKKIEATEAYADWQDYAEFVLAQSPTLFELARTHPRWFPALTEFVERQQSANQLLLAQRMSQSNGTVHAKRSDAVDS